MNTCRASVSVPADITSLLSAPVATGTYSGVEHDTSRAGLFGPKGTSTRTVEFTNDLNLLRTKQGDAIVWNMGTDFDDAVRAAKQMSLDLSVPEFGARVTRSLGLALLQAGDGAYLAAAVGTGKPTTSMSQLSYPSDRFDGNVHGDLRNATSSVATSGWTARVGTDGQPVDADRPDDARPVGRNVSDMKRVNLEAHTPLLKAIVDFDNVVEFNQ